MTRKGLSDLLPVKILCKRYRILRKEDGAALTEFALVLAILGIPLIFITINLAYVIYGSIEISDAAHAGALYGSFSNTNANNTSGIQTAAQADAPDFGTHLTVTPTVYWVCSASIVDSSSTGAYTTQSLAAAACPQGATNHYLEMIKVNASAPVTVPISIPGFATSYTVQYSSYMEVQE